MLYVFIVSTGRMMQFEMTLAVRKVQELKNEISRYVQIPQHLLVLLCNGGEELESDKIVGHYKGVGTDTNPIFLFSKCELEPYIPHLNTSIESNIEDDVIDCAKMHPSIQTATVAIALAQRLADTARKGIKECEDLVHSQHLQQQGWAAVIANLDELQEILENRKRTFEIFYRNYLTNRLSYFATIHKIPSNMQLLSEIPLLPKLQEDADKNSTLFSWFVTENLEQINKVADGCCSVLQMHDEYSFTSIYEEIENLLRNINNPNVKEIEGISKRLSQLNTNFQKAKQMEMDQKCHALSFNNYQNIIVGNPPTLLEMWNTIHKQLNLMLDNHRALNEFLNQCTQAKKELSDAINKRLLNYIFTYENEICRLGKFLNDKERVLRGVMGRIENFNHLEHAPERYFKLLSEVCRRKTFSTIYMKWAEDLSSKASKIYHKEIDIRKSFSCKEAKNMVDNLFEGMSDVPPKFAVECPPPFDQNLPNIEREDLDWLKMKLTECVKMEPELFQLLEVIPVEPMPYISQTESDSAFSSNVPFSRVTSGISEKVHGTKEEQPIDQLTVPPADFSSLPSEYASLPNEVFSLTSSPFEDPMLPTHMQEQCSRISCKSPSQAIVADSDGEEFETVDSYRMSPMAATSHSGLRTRPLSCSSDDANTHLKHSPKVFKARSDGDAVSPMQERFKSPDSLAISADFQAAEYYIDDSMPSSYTESNATSPLMRGNRMVKSHHVVVAELQRQVEEKSGALVVTKNSLENTHSNILKLHAKLSALQKFLQELHSSFRNDFSNFKATVSEELGDKMVEISEIVDCINTYLGRMEQQMTSDKETAISEMKKELASLERSYLNKLEVESEKLSDAENQIHYYEEHLKGLRHSYEETKHEKDLLESELQDKKEIIKRMMLEHEVEFDSYKNSIKETLQNQEITINKLNQDLSESVSKIHKLQEEKSAIEKESQNLHSIKSTMQDQHDKLRDELQRLQVENQSAKSLQEFEKKLDDALKEKNIYIQDLENAKEDLKRFKEEMEKVKSSELKDLEEKLITRHKSDLESLRSRFKLAVSMNSVEKLPSPSPPEIYDPESLEFLEEVKKIVAENHEKWDSDKLKAASDVHATEIEALKESLEEAQLKHEDEKSQIIAAMRSKHESAIEKLKARMTAENQVTFNEAINSLAKEKDAVIENLRSSLSLWEAKGNAIKSYLNPVTPSSIPSLGDSSTLIETGASSASALNLQKAEEKFRKDIEALLDLTDTTKLSYQQTCSSPETCENLKRLKTKEEEYSGLLTKYMSFSSKINRTPCVHCHNRLSFLTCEEGQLVLVCYEDKFDHYIIFHLGNHFHFLHTDSIAALDLKSPGEERWIVGKVIKKEFCCVKKVNNRFKLKVGTKFYRVKVERWGCGIAATRATAAALQRSIQIPASAPQTISARRNSEQSSLTTTVAQTSGSTPVVAVAESQVAPGPSTIQVSNSEQQLSSQSVIEVQPSSSGASAMSNSVI